MARELILENCIKNSSGNLHLLKIGPYFLKISQRQKIKYSEFIFTLGIHYLEISASFRPTTTTKPY